MNNKFKKIIDIAKTFSLTKEEKEGILKKISLFVKENPSPSFILSPFKERAGSAEQGIISKYFSSTFVLLKNNRYVSIALLLIFMLAGGTTAAASYSLPGDVLYPIKIKVNEKIESALALSINADAKVEAKYADKRLREAEELSVNGTIDTKIAGEIKNNFNKHAEKVEGLILKLKAKGNVEAADAINSGFESTLRVHQIVLAELAKNHNDDKDEIDEINGDVDMRLDSATETRSKREKSIISSSNQASVETAAIGSLRAANNKISEVDKYINEESNASTELKTKARIELDRAKEIIKTGEVSLEAKVYGEAFLLFHKAMRKAQEAKLLLKSENSLKIRVESELDFDDENPSKSNKHSNNENRGKSDNSEKDTEDSSSSSTNIKIRGEIETQNNDNHPEEDEIELEVESEIKIELD